MGYKPVVSPISVSSASLVLRRVVILATVGRETVVFRLLPSSGRAYPVLQNRSQHRRDVISVTMLFALSSSWKGPLELSLFSVTLSLALRMNRLKVCPPFCGFLLGLHIAPLFTLVDICRASVFLYLDSAYQLPLVFARRQVSRVPCY